MCYGCHIWSKEALMQDENDDLYWGQRSSEVKWVKLCDMATIFGQKNWWCKLRMMMTFMEVKGHQRSNMVTCAMATIFGQKNCWCKFRMMMTFTEVKGHQRSNVVNYATFLNIVILYYLLMRRKQDGSRTILFSKKIVWVKFWPTLISSEFVFFLNILL